MAADFNLGKGKYKHRIAEDSAFKRVATGRCQSYTLDEETIAHITELSKSKGCNKSSLIRILVQKAHEEIADENYVS